MRVLRGLVSAARQAAASAVPAVARPLPAAAVAIPPVPAGGPWVQPDQRTCGSACLVLARMLGDGDYARWMHDGTPDDRRSARQRHAEEVLAAHARTNRWRDTTGAVQQAWPRALGTTPWAVARELSATSGTAYAVHVVAPRDRGASHDLVTSAVRAGHVVPVFVGSALLPRHVVLATGSEPDVLLAHDPESGRRAVLPRDAWSDGRLAVSGWSEPWFAVVPAPSPRG